jgi:hypothetical protein
LPMKLYDRAMAWVLLFLVLLAAAFGILGAVLKAVVFVVLTLVLTILIVSMIAWWIVKGQARRFLRELDARTGWTRAGGSTKGRRAEEPKLPPTHDDRY